jgi:NAD-dependent DNA ligase
MITRIECSVDAAHRGDGDEGETVTMSMNGVIKKLPKSIDLEAIVTR